jgi:hypothetical protein
MNASNFIFDCYSPQGERFPVQGSKFLRTFLSEQRYEGIDWRVVARPLPSDACRFMYVGPAYEDWEGEHYVLFKRDCRDEDSLPPYHNHVAILTAAEIGQELGGN